MSFSLFARKIYLDKMNSRLGSHDVISWRYGFGAVLKRSIYEIDILSLFVCNCKQLSFPRKLLRNPRSMIDIGTKVRIDSSKEKSFVTYTSGLTGTFLVHRSLFYDLAIRLLLIKIRSKLDAAGEEAREWHTIRRVYIQ